MIKRKNFCVLLMCIFVSIILPICLVKFKIINTNNLLHDKNNFLYNLNSLSAVIAGFSFTSFSILISIIDKERIKRLWENQYLDNLFTYSLISVFCNLVSICISLYTLSLEFDSKMLKLFFDVNFGIFTMGIFFFVLSVIKFMKLLSKLK